MGKYYIEQNRDGRYLYYQTFFSESIIDKYITLCNEYQINGIARMELCQTDEMNGKLIRYSIQDYSILAKHIQSGISEEELLCILEQFVVTIHQINDTPIEEKRLIFDANCIFIDELTKKVEIIIHATNSNLHTPDFFTFIKTFVEEVQINCLQYNIKKCLLNYIDSQTTITLNDFDELIQNLKQQLFIQKSYSGQQSLSCRLGDSAIQVEEILEIASPKLTTVKMMEEETMTNKAYLVRNTTKERINITKAEFVIGKDRNSSDYAIEGNNAISRRHAVVLYRDGKYYMRDLDSTNHTFVNRRLVRGATEVQLCSGMNVMLANESFVFEVEPYNNKKTEDILF